MVSTILGALSVAWGWLRTLTWREIAAGLVTLGMAFLYYLGKHRGRNEERREQGEADRELSDQIRDRAHEAKERTAREHRDLDADELRERMHAKGRLRD